MTPSGTKGLDRGERTAARPAGARWSGGDRLLRRLLGSQRQAVNVLMVAAVCSAIMLKTLTDPGLGSDVFFHLKTGQWIMQHLSIPRRDPWSWTAPQAPWTAHEWLWGLLAWNLYTLAGWHGVEVLVVVAGVATLLLLTGAVRQAGRYGGVAALLVGACLAASLPFWVARPQTAGFALFAATLYLAARPGGVSWGYPLLVGALWANLHGGAALLGPGLLLVGGVLARIGPRPDPPRGRRLLAMSGLMALGTLANPWGPGLWRYAYDLAINPAYAQLRRYILEWQPPHILALYPGLAVAGLLALLTARLGQRPAPSWRVLVLTGIFWVAFAVSRRNLPYLCLWTPLLFVDLPEPAADRRRLARPEAVLRALVVAGAIALAASVWEPNTPFRPGSTAARYLAAAEVARAEVAKLGEPCANSYQLGDFRIWLGDRPSIDGRAGVYIPTGVFARYVAFRRGQADPPGACVVLARHPGWGKAIARLRGEGWHETETPSAIVLWRS